MSLGPKTITVFLDASPSGRKRVVHAATLAQRWGAHLVGVNVVFAGISLPASMSFARGGLAFKQVAAYKRQLDSDAEDSAIEVDVHFRSVCSKLGVSGKLHQIGRINTAAEAIHCAFPSDLVIVGHPEPHGLPDELSVEKLLLASGAPILIVPNAWEGATIGNKVLIGWNASREARRAVADAMGFLVTAESVTVLVIHPSEESEPDEDEASDIAEWLRRHGAHVDLAQLPSQGFMIPAVLLSFADHTSSDLLVIGAYSRARLKERLLGGTTRTLLTHTPMPTLMSR
jgi:nucleotide-binding universal stress UspA family protein